MKTHKHVRLLSDHVSDNGVAAFEELAAEAVGQDRYRLLDSPIAVFGCARGDVIRVGDDGVFDLVEQGGRISIQVFTRDDPESVRTEVMRGIEAWGGTLDNVGKRRNVFSVSLPLAVGNKAIAQFFDGLQKHFGQTAWQYGNAFPQLGGDEYLPWTREFFSR